MMFGRLRRRGERGLDRTLTASTDSARAAQPAGPDDEAGSLEALASDLQRLLAEAPAIDEQRVWLRVQRAMLAEPQRRSRMPRFAMPSMLLVAAPRMVLAGSLAIALLVGALLGSFLLQSRASVSAAFLDEMQRMAQASEVAATRGPLSAEDSAALEERALALLQLASRPEVLADLRPTEAELAHQRLMEARSALAGVVGENPGDTRALAALAAISGLLEPAGSAAPPQTAAPAESATSTAVATVAATATAREVVAPPATATVTATAGAAVTATSEPKATAPPQAQRPDVTRTPESKADDSNGQSSSPEARSGASTAASAVSAAQRVCSRVYDLASLGLCKTASATALDACAEARVARECQATAEAALAGAQQRVQRVGDDCERLPSSKARNACSEATNKAREISGSGDDRRNGGGQRNESDARGRRD